MLEKLKTLLGIATDDKDELLNLLISNAKAFVLSYCGLSAYTSSFDNVVLKMALEDYNRLGSEGKTSQSFSGLSESYNDDYSSAVYSFLKRYRRIKTL